MIHYGLALTGTSKSYSKARRTTDGNERCRKSARHLVENENADFKELDIGFVTEPAKQMSGDYIYFLNDE